MADLSMSSESLSWIAGFFDGEECVNTIKPHKDRMIPASWEVR